VAGNDFEEVWNKDGSCWHGQHLEIEERFEKNNDYVLTKL